MVNRASFASFALVLVPALVGPAFANGGPVRFVEPSPPNMAPGVVAPLIDLQAGHEARLAVLSEELGIDFVPSRYGNSGPDARISAAYTIENPTAEDITLEIGFPVLRWERKEPPEVEVWADEQRVASSFLGHLDILARIRAHALQLIERSLTVAGSPAVRDGGTAVDVGVRVWADTVARHLVENRGWSESDANLFSAYLVLVRSPVRSWSSGRPVRGDDAIALAALGAPKATKLLAHFAGRFDATAAESYAAVFKGWGADGRERSVDMVTGMLRPRSLDGLAAVSAVLELGGDPHLVMMPDTSRARTALWDATERMRSFPTMGLLRTSVRFPANSRQVVRFCYSQETYRDYAGPASYQLGYVIHPASLWERFGPIHLGVHVPNGVPFKASVPTKQMRRHGTQGVTVYEGSVVEKTGELFVAVDAKAWKRMVRSKR